MYFCWFVVKVNAAKCVQQIGDNKNRIQNPFSVQENTLRFCMVEFENVTDIS